MHTLELLMPSASGFFLQKSWLNGLVVKLNVLQHSTVVPKGSWFDGQNWSENVKKTFS